MQCDKFLAGKQSGSRLPRRRGRRAGRVQRWNCREDSILVDPGDPTSGGDRCQCSHQSRISRQCWLSEVIIRPLVFKIISRIRSSHHGSSDIVWIRVVTVTPLESLLAGVALAVVRYRRPTVVHMSRELAAVPHHIAHVHRIMSKNVVHLGGSKFPEIT